VNMLNSRHFGITVEAQAYEARIIVAA